MEMHSFFYSWEELIQHLICGGVCLEKQFFPPIEQFVSHGTPEISSSLFFKYTHRNLMGAHMHNLISATCVGKMFTESLLFLKQFKKFKK